MRIHHSKHHNGYVTNLNAAVKKLGEAEAAGDVSAINQCKLMPATLSIEFSK